MAERWPFALARLAFVRVGNEIRLPVPSAALALLETVPDEKTMYREPPTRKLALVSFPGELRIERDRTVVRFLPDRNCIVARRPSPGRSITALLVRVDVSMVHGCLHLRARYAPADEMLFLVIMAGWLAATGFHLGPPFGIVFISAMLVLGAVGQHRAARHCFNAAVDEMKRRIAAADPSEPHGTPAASETPPLLGRAAPAALSCSGCGHDVEC